MSALLKDIYSRELMLKWAEELSIWIDKFETERFQSLIFDDAWDDKSLKERMHHITLVLHNFLPKVFSDAAELLTAWSAHVLREDQESMSFAYMVLPDYIETFGIDEPDIAIRAMEKITQLASCEFAVRPFIVQYEDRMIRQMLEWSQHSSMHVRRLASEGCRPRLPWAMALPGFKKHPHKIIPILERLKDDPEEYVRRSVANNLNDISKDHPDVVLALANQWIGQHKNRDRLVKHACRTMLKQGQPEALALFGFTDAKGMSTDNVRLNKQKIAIGDDLHFSVEVTNHTNDDKPVRLEYGMYHYKANKTQSRKVFMIGEKNIKAHETIHVAKKHSFKLITTRKYYPGPHGISVIINGLEMDKAEFLLTE